MTSVVHDAVSGGALIIILGLTKAVFVDMLGNLFTAWVERHIVKSKRDLALWAHGFSHVQKDDYHDPRNPLKCRDGACPTLQTGRRAPQPQK